MARVKLSEYAAKRSLVLDYHGVSLRLESLQEDLSDLDDATSYIVKVDQGIKKRGKQGLLRLNVSKDDVESSIRELAESGFNRFIAEPMVPHDSQEEKYVSFERTRDGIIVSHSENGGVDIEDNPDSVHVYSIDTSPLPRDFVDNIVSTMDKEHLSFVEINPLILRDGSALLLDAAVLADDAGGHDASWSDDDIVDPHVPSYSEAAVAELNRNSPAAFSLRVLNPHGALWLLLSGGGASITIADEAMNQGRADMIGNYGEYSGGPSTEESYLYTKEVLRQMLESDAPKMAVIIAGGVANFTDVKKTFKGVIQALGEVGETLRDKQIKVFVRRGGPNEKEGLAMMKQFLEKQEIYGSVHGSDVLLTNVVTEALEYVDA